MQGWMKHKLKSMLPGEISMTSDMLMTTILKEESEEKLKNLLMQVREESVKAGLKLNIQKTKIMASGPITSWQIGKKLKTVPDSLFLESKITMDSDCSHENKRCWLLERKAITNLNSVIKKQRCHFADKGPCSQCYGVFSSHVWMLELDDKET